MKPDAKANNTFDKSVPKMLDQIVGNNRYEARPPLEQVHKEFIALIPRKHGANFYAEDFLNGAILLRDYKSYVLQDVINALKKYDMPLDQIKLLFGIYNQLLVDKGYVKAIDVGIYDETIFQNI